jgi:AhpD family alkylhydroperoxidase
MSPTAPDDSLETFRHFREKMNAAINAAYEAGVLDAKTKELMGLTASMVLRCDDCITYHLIRCREEGATNDELFEAFAVGLVVGGSIVIPHLRRAVATLEELPRA